MGDAGRDGVRADDDVHPVVVLPQPADLHAVVMGDPFVGIIHPCKIYNVLALGTLWLWLT